MVLVLGRHLELPSIENPYLAAWSTGGWIGVDLFFVLSGFLVSGLLFSEFNRYQKVDLKRFLIRRGFKIYPAFYALILFTIFVKFVTDQYISKRQLLGEVFFLQNYLGGLWNHTWSLAVEEHFYIGIALLCFFATKSSRNIKKQQNPFRLVPTAFFVLAISCLLMRIGNYFVFDSYSHKWFLYGTHIRIDSLMFGVFLSYLWHFHNLESRIQNVRTLILLSTGVLFLSPAFLFPLEQYRLVSVIGVVSFYLGSGLLVLAAVRLKGSRNRALSIGGELGAASYSIYLWHMPLATLGWSAVKKVTGFDDYLWYFLFYMIGSLVFGWIMSKMIEWPVLKFRDRLFPKNPTQNKPNKAMQATAISTTPDL